MLAHDTVEPALDAASQLEIGAVDRQDQAAIEHTRIEPVGQDKLDANGAATVVECFPPFVDPGEAVASALVLLADRRGNGRRLQAVERCAQPLIMVLARPAPDEGQNFVRTGGDVPRCRPACVARFDELTRRPNQNVGIPDGRHAVFGHGFDRDPCGPHCEVDRCGAPRLGKAEEGPGHQILSIARGNVTRHRIEQVELRTFFMR